MASNLKGKKIAILATDGFEQAELMEPRKALEAAGAQTEVISPNSVQGSTGETKGKIKGWNHTDWGESVKVDKTLDTAHADDYDALVLPGGVMNPDTLRTNPKAVEFVKAFIDAHKPVGAICHGPWMLVESGAVKGRTVTSWPSLQTDIRNAGGNWVDKEVVVDQGVVTSRKPADIPAFCSKLTDEIASAAQKLRKIA